MAVGVVDQLETKRMLDLAARLAMRSAGDVEPNPMVGAVIARDGEILGVGRHRRFGGPHAEREALANCVYLGNDPRGATSYVTLEPCRHTGKQPPCTEALIAAGVSRVVYARPDPGVVSGGGAAVLREAGIACEESTASDLATRLSDPFVHRVRTGRPWVIAKWAQTIDGRIATRTGESKWISSEESRRRVHRLRSRVDVMLTGLGTVLADDPMLTARGVARVRRVARRVVIDTDLQMPLKSRLVTTAREVPTVVAAMKDMAVTQLAGENRARLEAQGVEVMGVPEEPGRPGRLRLPMLLEALTDRFDATTVMVESGAGLLGSMFEQDLVDEAVVYVAPILLADDRALPAASGRVAEQLSGARSFDLVRVKRVGVDVELTYRRRRLAWVEPRR